MQNFSQDIEIKLIASLYIDKFKNRVDPQAEVVGNFRNVSKILHNYISKRTYFLHYIEEFWYSFGRFYPRIGGMGISVAKEELENARSCNSTIVIIMPHKEDIRFYGLDAETWYNFCEMNKTWNQHSAIDKLDNGSIPVKMLENLEKQK